MTRIQVNVPGPNGDVFAHSALAGLIGQRPALTVGFDRTRSLGKATVVDATLGDDGALRLDLDVPKRAAAVFDPPRDNDDDGLPAVSIGYTVQDADRPRRAPGGRRRVRDFTLREVCPRFPSFPAVPEPEPEPETVPSLHADLRAFVAEEGHAYRCSFEDFGGTRPCDCWNGRLLALLDRHPEPEPEPEAEPAAEPDDDWRRLAFNLGRIVGAADHRARTGRRVTPAAIQRARIEGGRRALLHAAYAWEDAPNDEMLALAERLYRPGGLSMPALWLRLRACEGIDQDPVTDAPDYDPWAPPARTEARVTGPAEAPPSPTWPPGCDCFPDQHHPDAQGCLVNLRAAHVCSKECRHP